MKEILIECPPSQNSVLSIRVYNRIGWLEALEIRRVAKDITGHCIGCIGECPVFKIATSEMPPPELVRFINSQIPYDSRTLIGDDIPSQDQVRRIAE